MEEEKVLKVMLIDLDDLVNTPCVTMQRYKGEIEIEIIGPGNITVHFKPNNFYSI